ncbi:MAG: hypothetical protein KAT85_12085 [candidate division Zixibacteria bacterium]|jgi:hypothetical protein|nr:hypothetical protein [candidate division Zixibacteria bacterium]
MGSSDLVFICISAFLAVFVLLSVLAVVMRIILVLFPEKESGIDAVVVAAVTSTVSAIYPGTRITKIEETR